MSKEAKKVLFDKKVFFIGSNESLSVDGLVSVVGYKFGDLPRVYLDDVDCRLNIGDGYHYITLPGYAYAKIADTMKNVKALRDFADFVHSYADALVDAVKVAEAEAKARKAAEKKLKPKDKTKK